MRGRLHSWVSSPDAQLCTPCWPADLLLDGRVLATAAIVGGYKAVLACCVREITAQMIDYMYVLTVSMPFSCYPYTHLPPSMHKLHTFPISIMIVCTSRVHTSTPTHIPAQKHPPHTYTYTSTHTPPPTHTHSTHLLPIMTDLDRTVHVCDIRS